MQLSYRGVKYTVPERNVAVEDGDVVRYRGASYRVKKAVDHSHGRMSGLTYRGAQVR
ncbi:MAG: DUF4278 domain-containing protein [Leptolyngbyaceae cyanobacterium MAG.088]|nr:DUF4278 domain-containing protein [Leptolyngbyaceae cyanobacterium MAG.088]